MRNWTKAAATRRDRFDYDNGRGRGNVKVEDNITQEYRAQEAKVPESAPLKKPKPKPASATARKSKATSSADEMMKAIMKRCMEYIHNQMRQIPDLVVEKLLEKLNKYLMYKPAAAVASDPVIDLTQPEQDVAYQQTVAEEKTLAKINVQNGASPTKPNDEYGATPKNPWIIGNSSRAASSDIDISATSITKFMAKAKPNKATTIGKDDDVMSGKRKRTVPKKFESPYALDKPSRRATRGTRPFGTTTASRALVYDNDVPEVVADELTPELIDAVVSFVDLASRCKKNRTKRVYYNASGNALSLESLRPVLDHKWLSDDVIDAYLEPLALRIGHDRHLCPAWRSKFLVDRALAWDNPLLSSCNMDSAMAKAGALGRVLEEYTMSDKQYSLDDRGNAHAKINNSKFWIRSILSSCQSRLLKHCGSL